MEEKDQNPTNFDLLIKHLKEKSLARLLVEAYCNHGSLTPKESMKTVIDALVEQLKGDYERTKD